MAGIIKYTDGQPSNVRKDEKSGFNVFVGISKDEQTNNLIPFLKDFLKYSEKNTSVFLETMGFNKEHCQKMNAQYEASKPATTVHSGPNDPSIKSDLMFINMQNYHELHPLSPQSSKKPKPLKPPF
jgi:hypothetical protein